MKLAVLMMVALGMLTAGSAAVVVRTIRAGATRVGTEIPTVEALVAADDLPTLTVVTADHVRVERVPRTALPKGHFVSPVQVIGKSLRVPVMKGQMLTQSCLAAPGSSEELTSRIPPGMRLFNISVSSSSVSGGLLDPGCIVDIMTPPGEGSSSGDVTAFMPLLQRLHVWAVNERTIVSIQDDATAGRPQARASGTLRVSLLVDTNQAQALQSAMNRGAITLVIRNPLDDTIIQPPEPVVHSNDIDPVVAQTVPKVVEPQQRKVEVIRGPKVEPKEFALKEQQSEETGGPNEQDGELPVAADRL